MKIISGILGVFSRVTDSGPPERITPLGLNEDIFSGAISRNISEYLALLLFELLISILRSKSKTKIVSRSNLDKELLMLIQLDEIFDRLALRLQVYDS